MRPSIAVEESVIQLGSNLRSARLRRRLPQSVVADRAGISLNTLIQLTYIVKYIHFTINECHFH